MSSCASDDIDDLGPRRDGEHEAGSDISDEQVLVHGTQRRRSVRPIGDFDQHRPDYFAAIKVAKNPPGTGLMSVTCLVLFMVLG